MSRVAMYLKIRITVEMGFARLRALTHAISIAAILKIKHSRNGICPIEGIDMYNEQL